MKITRNFYAWFLILMMLSFLPGKLFAQISFLTLKASKSYNPDQYVDFDSTLLNPAFFAIPEFLTISSGSAGNGTATLILYTSPTDSVLITYKGKGNSNNPQTSGQIASSQINNTSKYYFHQSSNKMKAGNFITAARFHLRVNSGNSQVGATVIVQPIPLSAPSYNGCVSMIDIVQTCGVTLTVQGTFPAGSNITWTVYEIVGTSLNFKGTYTGSPVIINTLPAGNYQFAVDVKDLSGNSCGNGSDSKIIGASLPVTASVSSPGCIGPGAPVTLIASASTGSSYSWKNAAGAVISTAASFMIFPSARTVYTVTASKSGICGSARVTVNVIPIINSGTMGTGICPGGSITLNLPNLLSGDTYQWFESNVAIAGATGSSYAATAAGKYTLKVTQAGLTCASNTITLTMLSAPSAPSMQDGHRCGPGQVTMSVINPVFNYDWFTSATLGSPEFSGASYSPVLSSTTDYFVQSTSACGTSSRTKVTGYIDPIPVAPIIADANRCGPGQVTMTITNPQSGYTYDWYACDYGVSCGSPLQSSSSQDFITNVTGTTTFYVNTISDLGCEIIARVPVTASVATALGPELQVNGDFSQTNSSDLPGWDPRCCGSSQVQNQEYYFPGESFNMASKTLLTPGVTYKLSFDFVSFVNNYPPTLAWVLANNYPVVEVYNGTADEFGADWDATGIDPVIGLYSTIGTKDLIFTAKYQTILFLVPYSVGFALDNVSIKEVLCTPQIPRKAATAQVIGDGMSKVFVYPNPNDGVFNISVPGKDNFDFVLYNSLGEAVLKESVKGESYVINKANLADGIYVLNIKTNGKNQQVKIMVKK
jgi:hypothetical protein